MIRSLESGALAALALCGTIFALGCNSTTASRTPAGVTIAPADTSIRQGESMQFRSAVVDSSGATIGGILPSLVSSDPTVLTVTSSGVAHTGSNIGIATVTASLQRLVGRDTFLLTARSTISVIDSSILFRLPLAGGPLGIAVGAIGVAYVTLDQMSQVARIDLATPRQTAAIAVGAVPSYISSNSTGTKLYVPNQKSDNIGVIDASSSLQSVVIPVHGDPLPTAVSVHDSLLFTTTNANFLYKIDLGTRAVLDSVVLPATSHHLLVHPNDTLVYVATRDGGSVLEVNWRTMLVARTFTLGGRTQGMAISPDTHELYVANELSNVLHVINLTTGVLAANVSLAGGGEGLALNSDGSRLYVGLVFSGKVQVLNRVARIPIKTIVTGGVPREIAADGPRQRMVVANESGWIDFVR